MSKRWVLKFLLAMAAFPVAADELMRYALLRPALPEAAAAGERAGSSVAQDGDWLLIGSPNDDDEGVVDTGRVTVFHWKSGRWQQRRTLSLQTISGTGAAQSNALFGASISVSGSLALIACPGCTSPNPKVFLVELSESSPEPPIWYPLYPALISAFDPGLGIGTAVAIHGNTVAVSAPNARSSAQGVERGAVAIGHFDGSAVIWDEILFGPSNPAGSRFGHSLAMTTTAGSSIFNGRRLLLIGAPAYVNSGDLGLAGRAYLYDQGSFAGGPWNLVREFSNDTSGLVDALGWSVAIDQASVEVPGWIALGAPGRSMNGVASGSAQMYLRPLGENADWFFNEEFTYSDAEDGDRFGIAIDVAEGHVLVGADRGRMGAYPDRGGAFLFKREGAVIWEEVRWFPCFAAGDEHECGISVSLNSDMAVIGHPGSYDEKGGATVFTRCYLLFGHGFESDNAKTCNSP